MPEQLFFAAEVAINGLMTGVLYSLVALTLFFQYSKQGRALRAVADDHQAALSVGISLRFIWVLVWSIAGIVASVASAPCGVQNPACSFP